VEAGLAEFAELCGMLESTSSRNLKVSLLTKYLSRLSPEEARIAAYLLTGLPPDVMDRLSLNVGWSTISEGLSSGPVATLDERPLTLGEVWRSLLSLSATSGAGSRSRRVAVLQSLFQRCGPMEREWLIRILSGEMRHGVNHGLMLEAVASLAGVDLEVVRRADAFVSDVGELAALAVSGGLGGVGFRLFHPMRPMLAEMCGSVAEALSIHGGLTSLEPKYDGVRVQVHIGRGEVRIFTRRLSDVTGRVPDVVRLIRGGVSAGEAVLDGEIVAVDEAGRPLPFQETMRRVGRERGVEEAAVLRPLRLWIFDALYVDGEALIDAPYEERRRRLEGLVRADLLAPRLLTRDPSEGEAFLRRVVGEGHEGVVAKDPGSPYTPGRRGGKWLKIKPAETIDAVIVAAEWGHGRRRGWLSNYHLAVLDEEAGSLVVVGKTFKGLTDEEFQLLTTRLLSIMTGEEEWGVTVRPEVVVEVAYNEVQRSPRYGGGLALRFARIARIRWDKSPREVDTLQRLREIYRRRLGGRRRPMDGYVDAHL